MILVVGGTGQVGSLVVALLRRRGHPVRVLARQIGSAVDLAAAGAEIVAGDLTDSVTVEAAVDGVDAIVATANSAVPAARADARTETIEIGYANLVEAAQRAGVSRFVVASVPVTPLDDAVPLVRTKRVIEKQLRRSSMSSLALRLAPFTEVWLALVGSRLMLRGEARATVLRPYRFLTIVQGVMGGLIDDHGVLVSPGPASNRNAFISTHDAAAALVASCTATDLVGEVDLGGPEVLSWHQVAGQFAEVLDRRVCVIGVPARTFHALQLVLAPIAPGAANIMALNRLLATTESDWDTSAVATRLGLDQLRTVSTTLRERLPADGERWPERDVHPELEGEPRSSPRRSLEASDRIGTSRPSVAQQ